MSTLLSLTVSGGFAAVSALAFWMVMVFGALSTVTDIASGVCTATLRTISWEASRASNLTTGVVIGLACFPYKAIDVDRSLGQWSDTDLGGSDPLVVLIQL